MTRSISHLGRITALISVGLVVLALPPGLTPALADGAPVRGGISLSDSNETASLMETGDTKSSTVSRQLILDNRTPGTLEQFASRSNLTGTLAVGDGALAAQQIRIADEKRNLRAYSPATLSIRQKLVMQRTVIRGADELQQITEGGAPKNQQFQAANLVTLGMKLQLTQMKRSRKVMKPSLVTLPTPAVREYASPSAAIFALVDRYNVTTTAEQNAKIRSLDDLPDPTRSELTDLLSAFLTYQRVTDREYADANFTKLQEVSNDSTTVAYTSGHEPNDSRISIQSYRSIASLQAAGVDVGQIRGAQIQLLDEAADFQNSVTEKAESGMASPTSHKPTPSIQVNGIVSIKTSDHNTNYSADYTLQIDVGGEDTYKNNAGGVNGYLVSDFPSKPDPAAAALIDLSGNDTYLGMNGGATGGVGFLLDGGSGNDSYVGGDGGTNGGGDLSGIGFLLDSGGADNYVAGAVGTNGGGNSGLGFLLDVGNGSDYYNAGNMSTNGGARYAGSGFLLDTDGADTYKAGSKGTNGGGMKPCTGCSGGSGILLDFGNADDTYIAGSKGTNGAGVYSRGFLYDAGGNDSYTGGKKLTNGAGGRPPSFRQPTTFGVGTLLDGGGSDTYTRGNRTTGDSFVVSDRGFIGIQVDLPLRLDMPDSPAATPTPPQPNVHLTPTPEPTQSVFHAEGTCDSYDNDSNTGNEENTDDDSTYASIQSAVDAATSGSTVLAHSCTYNESIVLETPDMMVRAVGRVVINGRNSSSPGIEINAANVTIRGFVIRNFNGTGTVVSGASWVAIRNVEYVNTEGIDLSNSLATTVLNNTVEKVPGPGRNRGHSGSGTGIHVVNSSRTVLRNNYIEGVGCCRSTGYNQLGYDMLGIYVESTRNATIEKNLIEKFGIGHQGQAGIVVLNNSKTTIRNNTVAMGMPGGMDVRGVILYGSAKTVVLSNKITGGGVGITIQGSSCSRSVSYVSCRSGVGTPSKGIIIQANTILEYDIGIIITNTRNTLIINNTIRDFSPYGVLPDTGIKVHGREGRVINATIISNTISDGEIGVRAAGSDNLIISSNSIVSTNTGIWTGSRVNRDYLRMFRSGHTKANEHSPTTGTVIRNNTIKRTFNGTLIGGGSSPRVEANKFIENRVAIHMNRTVNPALVAIRYNYFRENVKYSIYNANRDAILNASSNIWAGGLPASPRNNSDDNPIEDPYSGVLANGSGGAVTEGARDGVSNVHFCAESRANCLDPPTVQNHSAVEVETADTDAEFDTTWRVSDPGENLESVELTLVDDTDGETEDSASIDVSGGSASGTTRLVALREDGSGHNYTLELTATDDYESTATDTVTVTETERHTPTATPPATPTPTPTPPMATNGTGGGSGTGPGGSGAGGTGGSGAESTSGASTDAISQERTTSDDERTATKTAPPTPTDTPTETPRLTPTPEVIPGFGVAGWLVAFALLVGLFARRRE